MRDTSIQDPPPPRLLLQPWQLTRSWMWTSQEQDGGSGSGGEVAVSTPSPTGSLRILDAHEAAVPAPRTAAACLSPWQPGQKTNLLGSKLESYVGARS